MFTIDAKFENIDNVKKVASIKTLSHSTDQDDDVLVVLSHPPLFLFDSYIGYIAGIMLGDGNAAIGYSKATYNALEFFLGGFALCSFTKAMELNSNASTCFRTGCDLPYFALLQAEDGPVLPKEVQTLSQYKSICSDEPDETVGQILRLMECYFSVCDGSARSLLEGTELELLFEEPFLSAVKVCLKNNIGHWLLANKYLWEQ